MNQTLKSIESKFAIVALVFFTGVLNFDSLSQPSEGTTETLEILPNPLAPVLSLIQHSIFLVVICLLLFRHQYTIKTITQGKVIWILVFLVPFSVFWSYSPDITLRRGFAFMETCTFGLYLASRYDFKEQLKLIAWALGIAALISLFYTLAFPIYGIENGVHEGAWRGPYVQKNIFARMLALSCLSYTQITYETLIQKYLLFGGLILSFSLMILTNSKTALIILILLAIVNYILQTLSIKDTLAIPLVLTLFLLIGSSIIIIIKNAAALLAIVGKDLTLSGRTTLWTWLIEQIKLRPLFGYGYMGFWNNLEARSILHKYSNTPYIPPHSHNGYLDLVLNFGCVGMVVFIITLVLLIRRSYLLMRWDKAKERLWPILFLSFLLFYNFTEPTFIEHNSIFWIIYLSLAISRFIDFEGKPYQKVLH